MVERPMPLSAPASLGRPPPAGKLHTRPGYVGERAVAAGDPELGLLVPFPTFDLERGTCTPLEVPRYPYFRFHQAGTYHQK